jgi:hypothetical protein
MNKMPESHAGSRLPGRIAAGFVILTTSLWTFWGIGELYYEGWGLPFPHPLVYLIPAGICLGLSLLTLRFPRLGGWLLITIGALFTAWWWTLVARRAGGLTLSSVLGMVPLSALLIVTGILFLLEGRYRRRKREAGWQPAGGWWRRNLSYLLAAGIPAGITLVVSAFQLPALLGRYDDGQRGARQIVGNGVTLVWAPQGPGWNWRQEWGGYPSWTALALYGQEPIGLDGKGDRQASLDDMERSGLCAYLSADGLSLSDTPQHVWRMPTADEVIRSLSRDGENAGCTWNGGVGQLECGTTPDKETPLWNPDSPPIYYWAADEFDEQQAYFVSYNGYVGVQPKDFGNPRHGYRCVRAP